MTDMWTLAAELGLDVVERHGPHTSGYRPDDAIVHLTPGMRGRTARSVLAHEIGHHVLGHLPVPAGAARRRQEAAANLWAARQLISAPAYAAAEEAHGGHAPSMAFDLNVSTELVIVYQRQLLRVDSTTYVAPRMGAGQWLDRVEVA